MRRRLAIKNIALLSGSLITLPWWMGCTSGDQPATHTSSFSTDEQDILASIADTFIPGGNSIGALSMGVDKFLQKLLDDCYEQPVQANVKLQMKLLDETAKKKFDEAFKDCTAEQRKEMLVKFAASDKKEAADFYSLLRSETIRGFATSREVMEKYNKYKVAPGYYHGCINVKA